MFDLHLVVFNHKLFLVMFNKQKLIIVIFFYYDIWS